MSAWSESGVTSGGNPYFAVGWCDSDLYGLLEEKDEECDYEHSHSLVGMAEQEYSYVTCLKCNKQLLPWVESVDPHVNSGCEDNVMTNTLSYYSPYCGPSRACGRGLTSSAISFLWGAHVADNGRDLVIDSVRCIKDGKCWHLVDIPERPDFTDIENAIDRDRNHDV